MIAYIIDSLFFADAPDSANSYSVLAAFSDENGMHTISEIKADQSLADKIEHLPIFAEYKYSYDVLNDADGKSTPIIFSEILVNECDATALGQYPDLEIRRIQRVNNNILSGLKTFIGNPETKQAGLAFFCNYTDITFQLCPVNRSDVFYIQPLAEDNNYYAVVGQRTHDTLKTISDFWEDGTLKSILTSRGIQVFADLKSRASALSVNLVIPLADVKAHPDMFHILRTEDRDAKTILGSYSYFSTCNIISSSDISSIQKLSAFVDINKTTPTSDAEAIRVCNTCFADKLLITSEANTQFVVGLIHNGKCITMKDIVHLKGTYNLLRSILSDGTKFATAIFGANDSKPTCKIMYVPNAAVNKKIEQGSLVVEDVTTLPANEMRASLLSDYTEVGTNGISTVNLTELEAANSCLPENQGASGNAAEALAALCNSFDDAYDTVEQFTLCDCIEESVGFNSQSAVYKQASDVLNCMNRTVVQNTCVSTFNRQLPKFTDLLLIFDDNYQAAIKAAAPAVSSDTSNRTNVFDDESSDGLIEDIDDSVENEDSDDNIDIDDVDDNEDRSLSYADLDYLHIDLDYMRLDASTDAHKSTVGLGEYFDSKYYREIYAAFGPTVIASPECIEGNNANNKLAIQSNEIILYAGLYKLVLEGICYENKYYTLAELKKALSNGVHSVIADKFIRLLTQDVFNLNWRHTGTVKATLSRMINKRDIDFYNANAERASSETFMCLGWYNVVMDNGKRTVVFKDGNDDERFPAIAGYLSSEIINSMSWVEAFIRLARWNTRKPRQLWIPSKKLSNNTESFLNLVNFVKQDWCGTFDEAKRIMFDGAPFTIDGRLACEASKASGLMQALTYFGEKLEDSAELVYGVPLCTRYADTDETRTFYVDIFTLVDSIADNKLAVAGIMFDKDTQTFESSIVSSDTLIMDPDEFYNNDSFVVPLSTAISNSKTQPAAFETMISIHLTKLWTLTNLAQCLGTKFPSTRILDMLRFFELTTIDSAILDRCSKVLDTAPSLRENLIRNLNRDYGNSITSEALANMIMFTNLALPYIKLAQELQAFKKRTGNKPGIADVLNMARSVDLNRAATKSSAEVTTATPQSALFKSNYNKCTRFYSFAKDGHTLLYIGAIDTVIQGKSQSSYVLWEPDDIPSIIALGCADKTALAEPVSFDFVTTSVVLPYWAHCKIAYAGKNKTEITDVARRNALTTLKNLRQSRYISFRTGITGSTQAVVDTFTKFVFDFWVAEIRKQNRR